MTARVVLAVVFAACVPAVADAQVLERPQRTREPREETRDWHSVTLTANTLGSYDDNLTANQSAFNDDVTSLSGYTGYLDTTLRFDQGKGSRLFDVSGRGYVNAFRNVGVTPKYGTDALAHFSAGTRNRIELWQGVRNEPYYTIGGFSGLRQSADFVGSPDENPLNSSSSRRSWALASRADFTSQFTPRNQLGLSYVYDTRDYRDQIGDSRAGAGSMFYRRNLGRLSSLKFTYGYADSQLLDQTGWTPLQTHAADGGLELEHRFSRSRRMLVSFGGGAIRAFTRERFTREDVNVWVPAAYGTLRVDWARTWGMSADYRRSVSAVQGISAEAFATDAALVRVGGLLGRRVELTFSTGYAAGSVPAGVSGSYETYTSTAQMRLELMNNWSAVLGYDHYQYDLRGIDPILRQLPTNVQRNAVRVGLTIDLPLAAPREPRTAGK
jgi:hypothetical protein